VPNLKKIVLELFLVLELDCRSGFNQGVRLNNWWVKMTGLLVRYEAGSQVFLRVAAQYAQMTSVVFDGFLGQPLVNQVLKKRGK
jgi:hypothetical protein